MEFQEPKIEFVNLSMEDVIATSGGGTSSNVCQGGTDNSCSDDAKWL